jgi:hypothetical protein
MVECLRGIMRTGVVALGLLAVGKIGAETAFAAEPNASLRVGHYSTGDGMAGFVLDRLATPVKVRFDDSDEILALTPEPAPLDSFNLMRDDGKAALRVYDNGQVLLFGDRAKNGSANAYRDKNAQPLTIRKATKAQALAAAASLSQQLKRDAGVPIAVVLEAPRLSDTSANWAVLADAVTVTGIAVRDLLATKLGKEAIAAKVKRIVIRTAGGIDITFADGTLAVEVVADKPVLGRPSSLRLKSAMGDLL